MIVEHDLRRRNCVLNQLKYWVTPDGLTVVLPGTCEPRGLEGAQSATNPDRPTLRSPAFDQLNWVVLSFLSIPY